MDSINYLTSEELQKTALESPVKSFNRKGATLANQKVITDSGISDIQLKEGFNFLNKVENTIISADNDGKLRIVDIEIVLNKVIVAASIKDTLVAIVFADNSIALYDMAKKQIVFKEYYKESLVNDIRIENPIFMKDIILFPTLDGKVIVVSIDAPKVLRTILVDSSTKFNNISYFDIVDNALVAASANQIISLTNDVITKEFEIRDIIRKDKFIYLATLDGQILKLDPSLNILAKTKFKYAKVYSLGVKGDYIYALESQGYIIRLDNDLQNESIYSLSFNNEAKSVTLGDKIYFQQTKLNEASSTFYNEDFYITLP